MAFNSMKKVLGIQIKFMSYNVWRREDVVLYERMKAIGDLVEKHKPDVVFFQEVTPDIRDIFESLAFWEEYPWVTASERRVLLLSKFPLENVEHRSLHGSPTGRGYRMADININLSSEAVATPPIRVATGQLERPSPPSLMRFRDRYVQAQQVVTDLSGWDSAVFGGDLSWCDDTDKPFPLPAGWVDAWTSLCSSYNGSWTYDAFWEVEATKFNGYAATPDSMTQRSDRFVRKLKDYKLSGIELIGEGSIGPKYSTKPESSYSHAIHLMPSCHRRLVLTIVPNEPAPPTKREKK